MNIAVKFISRHFSLRLGLLIMLIVAVVFGISLTLFFLQSKQVVRHVAVQRATLALNESVSNISEIIEQTESSADETERSLQGALSPDSLASVACRLLAGNAPMQGLFIALKPKKESSRADSLMLVFACRVGDSIVTARLTDYDYTKHPWYRQPLESGNGEWLEPYLDRVPTIDSIPHFCFSYTRPFRQGKDNTVGVICCDLSLRWLSLSATGVKPFPNSSAIMLSHDGSYIVHPDTAKVGCESIFSDPDPEAREGVITLGHDMLSGKSGSQELVVDHNDAHVFYRPLARTGWSIAIVCPDSDVFSGLSHVFYIAWNVIVLALLLMLLVCFLIIRRSIAPLKMLARQANYIADGHFDQPLPRSRRSDIIGDLQNAFRTMKESIHRQLRDIRTLNQQTEQKNRELQTAYKMVSEADEQKTAFVQNMTHQVRTPLNIINGFAQVIAGSYMELPADELDDIRTRMKYSARVIRRITRMLVVASSSDSTLSADNFTSVGCNALCRSAVEAIRQQTTTDATIEIQSQVPDSLQLHTQPEALGSVLSELLDNAVRYAPNGVIAIACCQPTPDTVEFSVTDNGPGISAADRERVFAEFTKLDSFSEGIGLGLALCRHTAKLLGGTLSLDDGYSGGSRFVVVLPVW